MRSVVSDLKGEQSVWLPVAFMCADVGVFQTSMMKQWRARELRLRERVITIMDHRVQFE